MPERVPIFGGFLDHPEMSENTAFGYTVPLMRMKSSFLPVRSFAALVLGIGALTGCSSITASLTGRMSESLSKGVLNQNDPETVRQGAPAYLIMIDGFISDDPENADVLMSGAQLYAAYSAAFVEDADRAKLMSLKARDYGRRALCLTNDSTCGIWEKPYDQFETVINGLQEKDIEGMFVAGMTWATWIQANRDDWAAIADKARVESIMLRVVSLDEAFRRGSAHLYLGVLATLIPEALGGKPEEGRKHFERSIELSGGQDLMAKVLLARDYARLVFDRDLHDRLCREVIAADPDIEGLTLNNTMAQREAQALLDDSQDYFGE